MNIPIVPVINTRLTPIQENSQSRPTVELYVGQVLKAVVVNALTENQVSLNINGQNINANSAHKFAAGDVLKVEVQQHEGQIVLQVLDKNPSAAKLQAAIMRNLPLQHSPAVFVGLLNAVLKRDDINPQIKSMLQNWLLQWVDLKELPQQMTRAINQSGVFFEAALLNAKEHLLKSDFNAKARILLQWLNPEMQKSVFINQAGREAPPLPGMLATPTAAPDLSAMQDMPATTLLQALGAEAMHVLARIQTQQSMHLLQSEATPYFLMLDLPLKTPLGPMVVPLTIEQEKATAYTSGKWKMSFALDLPGLGAIQGVASLHQTTLDVQLHAEQAPTLTLLADNKERFAELIQASGLSLGTWGLHQGIDNNSGSKPAYPILDINI